MSGAEQFLTNRLTWVSLVFIFACLGLAKTVDPTSLNESARTLATVAGMMGFIGYASTASRAYKAHRWPNPDLLTALGHCVTMVGVAAGGLFQMLWRLSGYPLYVVNNDVYAFTVLLIATGIFISIATPNFFGDGVRNKDRAVLGVGWAVAAIIIVSLSVFQPDLRPIAALLEPVLSERPEPP